MLLKIHFAAGKLALGGRIAKIKVMPKQAPNSPPKLIAMGWGSAGSDAPRRIAISATSANPRAPAIDDPIKIIGAKKIRAATANDRR